MSSIVVNDTNIFIDLCKLNLLDKLFALPFEVHTVDFVINELIDENQHNAVEHFRRNGKLTVHASPSDELTGILSLQATVRGNLSFTDCAVWYYAKENSYTLLTGDAQLRRNAIASNVPVRGIIFLFDKFVEENILSQQQAACKLVELLKVNSRLPHGEIISRINKWSK